MKRKTTIKERRDCGDGEHQVVTVSTKDRKTWNRLEPCEQCPWRKDLPTGVFPAEAFRISASTAYDMSERTFACHMGGTKAPVTCAGFLLKNAANNMAFRIAVIMGKVKGPLSDGDKPLYDSYRAMAIANGVDPDDPVLKPCRDN